MQKVELPNEEHNIDLATCNCSSVENSITIYSGEISAIAWYFHSSAIAIDLFLTGLFAISGYSGNASGGIFGRF